MDILLAVAVMIGAILFVIFVAFVALFAAWAIKGVSAAASLAFLAGVVRFIIAHVVVGFGWKGVKNSPRLQRWLQGKPPKIDAE